MKRETPSFRDYIASGSESARRPSLPDVPLIEDRGDAPPRVEHGPVDELELPMPVDNAATFVRIDGPGFNTDDPEQMRAVADALRSLADRPRIDLTTEEGAREFVRRLYEEEDAIVEGPKVRTSSIAFWLGVAALVVLGGAFALTMLARVAH